MAGKPQEQAIVDEPGDRRVARTRVRGGTLADAVKDVAGVVMGKNTIPILDHVLVSVVAGAIGLTATNLDMWVVRSLASDDSGQPDSAEWKAGSGGFELTLPARQLLAVLGELDPDAMVTLEAPRSGPCAASPVPGSASGGDETRAVLKAGRARFKLLCLPVGEFPAVPAIAVVTAFEARASALADHFARVEHAISSEDTRYYLNGVHIHPVGLDLRFVATDGHRLARLAVDAAGLGLGTGSAAASWPAMIVGTLTVGVLDKLLAGAVKAALRDAPDGAPQGDRDTVVVEAGCLAGSGVVSFALPAADGGEVRLVAKTIDGTFPDYERVIPSDPPLRATLDRAALAQAVKRVGVMTAKSSRLLKFEFGEGKCAISGSSPELGEGAEELPCDYQGEPLSIGFDHKYLREALLALASDTVVLAMSDPGGACRIEAGGAAADGAPALVQVVMPSRV